jgi:hypothetical protein
MELWEEEARQYAENAAYWRSRCEEAFKENMRLRELLSKACSFVPADVDWQFDKSRYLRDAIEDELVSTSKSG